MKPLKNKIVLTSEISNDTSTLGLKQSWLGMYHIIVYSRTAFSYSITSIIGNAHSKLCINSHPTVVNNLIIENL